MPRPRNERTCVGCRQRTAKSELLRVVLTRNGAALLVVPDPDGQAPGRGAHLHPTTTCLAMAERRRAFARAFRAEGSVDVSPLRRHVEQSDTVDTDAVPQAREARDQARYRTTGRGSSGS